MDFDKEVGPLNTTKIHFDFVVPPVVDRYHHAHELWQLPYGNSIWNSLMDNVYFSSLTLRNYLNNNLSKFLFTWQQYIDSRRESDYECVLINNYYRIVHGLSSTNAHLR